MKLRSRVLVALACATLFVLAPFLALAAEQQVRAAVTLAAIVPTPVVVENSVANVSTTEVLADASQATVISTILKDKNDKVVAGSMVFVYSNRGSIDKITPIDADGNPISAAPWGISVAYAASQTIDGNTGTAVPTDSKGQAHFKVSSDVPGQATITVVADSLVTLGEFKITFDPLPFPKYLSVGIEVPRFINPSGQVTVFKPAAPGIGTQQSGGGIVNLGTQLIVPFWAVMLIAFLIILTPFLVIHILLSLTRIRRNQIQQKGLLTAETAEIQKEEALIRETKTEIEKLEQK